MMVHAQAHIRAAAHVTWHQCACAAVQHHLRAWRYRGHQVSSPQLHVVDTIVARVQKTKYVLRLVVNPKRACLQ